MKPTFFVIDLWKRYLNVDLEADIVDAALAFDREETGQFDVAYYSKGALTGVSMGEYLGVLVTGDYRNNGKWSNQEYDQLYSQILGELDVNKRVELARKAQMLLYAELPQLVFHSPARGTAWRPDLMTGWPAVKGHVMQTTQTGQSSIDRIWLANTPDAERWIKTQKK
ncbi:hypothetical protein ACFLYE_04590 [Chloroflexota bacterium]